MFPSLSVLSLLHPPVAGNTEQVLLVDDNHRHLFPEFFGLCFGKEMDVDVTLSIQMDPSQ